MARKQRGNWDTLQSQSAADSARNRDVYELQQMERGHMEQKQSMRSRMIFTVVVAIAVFFFAWFVAAQVERTGITDGLNRGWYRMFYAKDGVNSDYQYLTLREEIPKFEDDGETPVIGEDGQQEIEYGYTKYIWYLPTGVLTNVTDGKSPGYTACGPATYDEDGNLSYAYEGTEQEGTVPRMFLYIPAEALSEENPEYLGKVDEWGYVFRQPAAEVRIDYDGDYASGDEVPVEGYTAADLSDPVFLSGYGFEPVSNPNVWMRLNRGKVVDTSDSIFHDNFVDYRPTPLKLVLGLLSAFATFAILYAVMKRNLATANAMADTTDINTYQNDAHIALPQEVQRDYDIFPDVGAHSHVMVSSMISHQAITNKGLKKVKVAKRADKDILDEDGDIETYKGDILRDADGEPIMVEMPIIDTEFTEALFDSAKVMKDKKRRMKFDTPDIPYNPDGSNLDKLKGYKTVADLINGDWTFPEYEPQRPGGVYIVDTAPVNTMV